ncbi:uncharacterized protein LOC143236216 [Tachypleus tridentatus]|uniref:uncharacterized protein LOC143236216 n=1 Tax=Tachypleus tridentatus TaxID=6853 RepID=UPI003FCF3F01
MLVAPVKNKDLEKTRQKTSLLEEQSQGISQKKKSVSKMRNLATTQGLLSTTYEDFKKDKGVTTVKSNLGIMEKTCNEKVQLDTPKCRSLTFIKDRPTPGITKVTLSGFEGNGARNANNSDTSSKETNKFCNNNNITKFELQNKRKGNQLVRHSISHLYRKGQLCQVKNNKRKTISSLPIKEEPKVMNNGTENFVEGNKEQKATILRSGRSKQKNVSFYLQDDKLDMSSHKLPKTPKKIHVIVAVEVEIGLGRSQYWFQWNFSNPLDDLSQGWPPAHSDLHLFTAVKLVEKHSLHINIFRQMLPFPRIIKDKVFPITDTYIALVISFQTSKRKKSLHTSPALKVVSNRIEEEENIPPSSDLLGSSPVLRPRTPVKTVVGVSVEKTLTELKSLLEEGHPPSYISNWLDEVVKHVPFSESTVQFWECRALVAEKNGDYETAVEILNTALDKGVEPVEDLKSVVSSLRARIASRDEKEDTTEENMIKLDRTPKSVADLSASKKKRLITTTPRQPLVDKANMFESTLIQYSLSHHKPLFERISENLDIKAIVTPVRRSSRLSVAPLSEKRSQETSLKSLTELPFEDREKVFFYHNDALGEKDFE